MKTLTNLALTFAAVTLFAACSNTQKSGEESHEGHSHAAGEGHGAETVAAKVSLKDDHLNAIYPHYIHLTTALINEDIAEAKVASQAIELGAKALDNGAAFQALTAKISEAKDLKAQRTAYAALSTELIQRVKTSGLSSGELYVEYCPMAENDKGASWLSSIKEIKNPYFGESMMTCGEVKETIK